MKSCSLSELTIGSRFLYRSKTDWRFAAVSRIGEENAVIVVCSPKGRTYRLSRSLDSELYFDGIFLVLRGYEDEENWRDNFAEYDPRW